MANKLELTWYGKDEPVSIEPRLLIENSALSNTSKDPDTENMIIHGDNLLALKALEHKYAGKIKCIYIDPPYNTGEAFKEYDDNLEHSLWLGLMYHRLKIFQTLLSDDGVLFVQLNDEEMNYCKVMLDEIFGRNNFVNIISLLSKVSAGASGGGEDKRLKKNIEYILVYSKNILSLKPFYPIYKKTELMKYISDMKAEGKSYKYTSVLVKCENITPYTVIQDGGGGDIVISKVNDYEIKSVKQTVKDENLSEEEVYKKYFDKIMTTTNAQTSIRTRVWDATDSDNNMYIATYVPKSGKNKGKSTDLIFMGKQKVLVIWLKDTAERDGKSIFKKEKIGTFWDGISYINVNKEGGVVFTGGKKPEALIQRILEMATDPGDLVLDSFLGSGSTAATAHKLNRRYIGIELGDHCYTHCLPRLQQVINGDPTGISPAIGWQGGGGYRFYELANSLINKDEFDEYIINKEYDADMLAAAVALHEGFSYKPDGNLFWKQSIGNENSYLFVTTRHLNSTYIDSIKSTMEDEEYLIIACRSFENGLDKAYKNITIKKIPQMLLNRCEFGKADYNLNIIHPPVYQDEWEEEDCDE